MNNEEIEALIKQLKAQGLSEDEIMDTFYQTFTEGKMDRKDLETLADAMGYELTDDFKNEPAPDPIAEGGEGMSKEDLEDAKAIEPGESAEEFKEELEGAKSEEKGEETEEKEEVESEEETEEEPKEDEGSDEGEEEDEDEEWEKAQKMFKI